MDMSDMFLHICFLLELGLTFRHFTFNIFVFMEIFDMVGKTGLFEKLGRATDFAAGDVLRLSLRIFFFFTFLIVLPVIVQGFHMVVTLLMFILLFFPVHHPPGCIQAQLLDLCLVLEEKLFVLDGDCLQVEEGKEDVFAVGADVVWEESAILQARLQLQGCLDRLSQRWVLHKIVKNNFLSVFLKTPSQIRV